MILCSERILGTDLADVLDGWVRVEGDEIAEVGTGAPPADAGPVTPVDGWLMPGLVDIHVHGAAGHSFDAGDPVQAARIAEHHRRHGTTTLVASLGFVPMDRAMIYVTGGLAYGDTKLSAAVAGTTLAGSKTDTNVGWTLGGGVEYALTNNITTKIEYLYYDLGDTKLNLSNGVNTASYKANNNGSIIRAGLNYKF